MNEFDFALEDMADFNNPTTEVILDSHFQNNANCHCDLFETNFYKEFWHSFQASDKYIIGSVLEQLVENLRP
ncbi:MAG: hypothetical protein Kow0029_09830 [Candidatus Rifleibacteriota bacterium]